MHQIKDREEWRACETVHACKLTEELKEKKMWGEISE